MNMFSVAIALQALTDSLPNSPPPPAQNAEGQGLLGEQQAGAKTPQTSKKRKLGGEGYEGIWFYCCCKTVERIASTGVCSSVFAVV